MSDDRDDDKVGYRKPPRHARFKKGQSGNPNGRPKKAATGSMDIAAVLDAAVPVRTRGRARNMPAFEVMLRQLARKAIRERNLGAALEFKKFCEEYDVVQPAPAPAQTSGVLRVPYDWDWDEWMAMFEAHGPPPWPGERSGLPEADTPSPSEKEEDR